MKQYLNLVQHIQDTGHIKTDRTGTGTKSIFGYQMRFNLQDGFPLVTSKKTNFNSILTELLWFLKGDTNTDYLMQHNVKIWEEWKDDNNNLGPVYGEQWRSWKVPREVVLIKTREQPHVQIDVVPSRPDIDEDFSKLNRDDQALWDLWLPIQESIETNATNNTRQMYDPAWYDWSTFKSQVELLPNFYQWKANPSQYALANNYYRYFHDNWNEDHYYSKDTCSWLHMTEWYVGKNKERAIKIITPEGNSYLELTTQHAGESIGFSYRTIEQILLGQHHPGNINGFTFEYVTPPEGFVYRYRQPIDQITEVIDQIKSNPDSRRLIVCGWNPVVLPDTKFSPSENAANGKAALPPCHTLFQFYVCDGKLSCQLYQRSADVFLGVPFNIASYALLTHMIAQVCDLEVGEFIHTFGDAHLYLNHKEQIEELLSRNVLPLPTLKLNPNIKNIFEFTHSDFDVINYQFHPYIKAPIAV